MSELTIRQQLWVEAYRNMFNATEAARQAGYGTREHGLCHVGYLNRHNPKVQAALEARLAEMAMSTNPQKSFRFVALLFAGGGRRSPLPLP